MSESAVISWETDPLEVVADSHPMAEAWKAEELPYCKPLRSNIELVVRQMPASEDRSHGTRRLRDLRHWECYWTTGEDTAD
jgi:hypothetical protein